LGTRQRLRDAVGARAGVLGLVVPVALLLPQRLEAAAELVAAPAVVAQHRLGDGLGVAAGGGRGGVVAPGAGGVVGGALLLLLLLLLLGLGGAGGGNGSARLLDALLGLLALRGALVVGDVLHVGEEVLLAGLRGVSRHGRVRRVVGLHAAVGQRRDTEDGAGDDRGAPDCRGSAQRNPVGQQESPFRQSHAGKRHAIDSAPGSQAGSGKDGVFCCGDPLPSSPKGSARDSSVGGAPGGRGPCGPCERSEALTRHGGRHDLPFHHGTITSI